MADTPAEGSPPPPREADRLRGVPLFRGLSATALATLLADATRRTIDGGTTLFLQDEPADRFYVLLDGWVKLYRVAEDGTQAIVTIVLPGETFAEAAVFASGRYPVCAETVGTATMLSFGKAALARTLAGDPDIAFAMLSSLSVRLRHLVERIEQLQARSAPQRLASFLLRLCPGDDVSAAIVLPFPKALVAERIGIRPETFSRALAKLRPLGVDAYGPTIRIRDVPALRAYCGADRAGDDVSARRSR